VIFESGCALDAAGNVHAPRSNGTQRLGDVIRIQTARQQGWKLACNVGGNLPIGANAGSAISPRIKGIHDESRRSAACGPAVPGNQGPGFGGVARAKRFDNAYPRRRQRAHLSGDSSPLRCAMSNCAVATISLHTLKRFIHKHADKARDWAVAQRRRISLARSGST
jgi:hypothetical protein